MPAFDPETVENAVRLTMVRHCMGESAARQIVEYLAGAKAVLGVLPTQRQLVIERFFDEAGGMQLVLHSPFGARINRALGLALRKRFCQSFNFELQAAATEDAIVLSLGETHSFDLADVPRYLNSRTVEHVLTQAVLDAPLFVTRWRWNATISLAVKTARGGKKIPAPLLRMASEDLLSVLFPDQLACAENLRGDREVPDHPLVRQTLHDCLHEAMDLDGLIALLRAIESGEREVLTRDLPHPSPLAMEILGARPYAYLDDAPLEERRTQAVAARRWLDPQSAADFGRLDPLAIARVRAEAWPSVEDADELHDALMLLGLLAEGDEPQWQGWFETLLQAHRGSPLQRRRAQLLGRGRAASHAAGGLWRVPDIASGQCPRQLRGQSMDRRAGGTELVRGRLQAMGPVTAAQLASTLSLPQTSIDTALRQLEGEGFVLRGQFSSQAQRRIRLNGANAGCSRAFTVLRCVPCAPRSSRSSPQTSCASCSTGRASLREPRPEGMASLAAALEQLEGYELPAVAWESEVLPARLRSYDPAWLDSLCLSGRVLWARQDLPRNTAAGPVRSTPIALLRRQNSALWRAQSAGQPGGAKLSSGARAVAGYLQAHGASFFDEVLAGSGLLASQVEDALGELVAAGLISSDSFSGLRALLLPLERKRKLAARGRRIAVSGLAEAGRWSLIRSLAPAEPDKLSSAPQAPTPEHTEAIAWLLLRRYGVVFRKVLTREPPWLPPWHQLLRVYRRLEAQGQIRGGRFVAGTSGEQYALPDAVSALRAVRRRARQGLLVSLSAADPLNLIGIITPGVRLAALAGNRFLLRDGVPLAIYAAGQTQFLESVPVIEQWALRTTLLRHRDKVPARDRAKPIGLSDVKQLSG